jgi:hypothetical protein
VSLLNPTRIPKRILTAGLGASALRYLDETTIDRILGDLRSSDPAWVRAAVLEVRARYRLPEPLTEQVVQDLADQAWNEWQAALGALGEVEDAASRALANGASPQVLLLALRVTSVDEHAARLHFGRVAAVARAYSADPDDPTADIDLLAKALVSPVHSLTFCARRDLLVVPGQDVGSGEPG